MDLLRVALGLHRGSKAMAEVFRKEALKREEELESLKPEGYLKKLLLNSRNALMKEDDSVAENALMYSTLFRNLALKNYHRANNS